MTASAAPTLHDVLIVGAGFSGLGAAVRLRRAGVKDIVVLERSDRVGGTWRDAVYPGAACDIPSLLYSFSFAPNPHWTRAYSPSAEIHRYIEHLVEHFGLAPLIRFRTTVEGLRFDERDGSWTVSTDAGEYRARAVVLASGPLSDASLPAIRGLADYRGQKIHSARWDLSFDARGRDVAVIGTGASAVQIVPELVRTARSVKVFQRTPGWVLPRVDVGMPRAARRVFALVPEVQQAARTALFAGHEAAATGLVWDSPVTTVVQRIARAHLHRQVKDPWLRRQLTPEFRAGCKRMLMSSDWYPALQRPNCKLITWPIASLCADGIRTGDGIVHAVDAIVFATGYDVHLDGPPFPVVGRDGRSLADDWVGHVEAYKSIGVSGYPNLFLMTGPNSGPGHNSLLVYVEAQIDYAVRAITTLLTQDLAWLDVRPDVQRRYNQDIQKRLARTTWMSGCTSWYLTADGHNASMYPGFATQYRRQMRSFRLADHTVRRRPHAVAPAVLAR